MERVEYENRDLSMVIEHNDVKLCPIDPAELSQCDSCQ